MAMSKTREQFPLCPSKPIKKTLGGMIVWLITWIFIIVPMIFGIILNSQNSNGLSFWLSLILLGWIVLTLIIFVITYIYERWYYEVYYYDLNDNFIVIRKGVVTPREISIPYERVQDVYVDQDILDRLFNMYDVHLSSATISSGMEAHIDGVEKPAADGLRELLLKTIHERISKTASTTAIPPQNKNV